MRTEGLELRALVPVSIRAEDERGTLGNRIAAMRGPLPVYIEDPVERLRAVRQAMDGLKESKQAVGAEVLAGVQNFAPPTILAQASRLNFSTRLFNLIVTNVPGPQFPLYVLGREMLDVFPVAFLPKNHALAIAIMSYNGAMNFGLLGDFDALPDIDDDRRGHRGLARRAAGARARAPREAARAERAPGLSGRAPPPRDPRVGLPGAGSRLPARSTATREEAVAPAAAQDVHRRDVRRGRAQARRPAVGRAPELEARDAGATHARRRRVGRRPAQRDRALGRARGAGADPRGRRAAVDGRRAASARRRRRGSPTPARASSRPPGGARSP